MLFRTHDNICPKAIRVETDREGIIRNVEFQGGCPGNTRAIAKLIEGKPSEEVIKILKGNRCGGKSTSCADQLAEALQQNLEEIGLGTNL